MTYLADWLGIAPSDVTYAVDDQLAAGDMFASGRRWPLRRWTSTTAS